MGFAVLLFAMAVGNYEPETKQQADDFRGIIRLYDIATPTVLGNDFSVTETICEEFSRGMEMSFVRLNKISYVTQSESYAHAVGNADIIRYDESLDRALIMTDEEFTASLDCDFYDIPAPYDNSKVMVPLWYDVYVIVVNREIIDEETMPEYCTPGDFSEACRVISENGIMAGCVDERALKLFTDEKYPSYSPDTAQYFTVTEGGIKDFYEEKTAVFLGTLKDVAYLVRQEKRGKEVPDYEIMHIPSAEKAMYVSEIASYAALTCEDEVKKGVIMDFMAYLQSDEAVRYTENLGLLPWCGAERVGYEKYPYLKDFALFDGRRVLVE